MLVEDKLCKWLTAGLALYKAQPLMLESVFFDGAQLGWPSSLEPALLYDAEKVWIPDEWAGGTLRWAGVTFPILGNTAQSLSVDGDPSIVEPIANRGYQIVPPAVALLMQFLQTEKFSISSTFNQVPTSMPAITVRLEKDAQADTYLGDSLKTYGEAGVEFDIRQQAMQGSYLLSIWSTNREATLYLYAWLMTYALQSMGMFATWGLYDVSLAGSDLDPALQYLAERTYVRHLLFTATRVERAVTTRAVEWVDRLSLSILGHYAVLADTVPWPMP